MSHLTYAEAGFVGLLQGITELFPVSSLGHNVLLPALVLLLSGAGAWAVQRRYGPPADLEPAAG